MATEHPANQQILTETVKKAKGVTAEGGLDAVRPESSLKTDSFFIMFYTRDMIIKLIKHHPSIELGHLYEHLFCMKIKSHMYKNGLFKYIDFSLRGLTFEESGLIDIELVLYTKEAKEELQKILEFSIDIDDKSVGIALLQLLAEEELPVYIEDSKKVIDELKLLDSQPWQQIDEFEIFDSSEFETHPGPLYITDQHQPKATIITSSLRLNNEFTKEHRKLLPLFRKIATLITETAQDRLSIKFGTYYEKKYFKNGSLGAESLIHHTNKSVQLENFTKEYVETIRYITDHQVFDKLVSWLQNISYKESSCEAPETRDSYKETGIYIGSKGWNKLSTKDNLNLLLSNTNLEIEFNNKKIIKKLKDIST